MCQDCIIALAFQIGLHWVLKLYSEKSSPQKGDMHNDLMKHSPIIVMYHFVGKYACYHIMNRRTRLHEPYMVHNDLKKTDVDY